MASPQLHYRMNSQCRKLSGNKAAETNPPMETKVSQLLKHNCTSLIVLMLLSTM